MTTIVWIASIALVVFAVAVIAVVVLQEGHQAGMSGAIAGGSDSYLGQGKANTLDAFLEKWTKVIAVVFFILAFVCDILIFMAH